MRSEYAGLLSGVVNTGKRHGTEVARLNLSAVEASVPRAVKELREFVCVRRAQRD